MKSKILITGGSGLVGSQFVGDEYIKPTSKDFNLIDSTQVNNMLLNILN